MPRKSLNDCVSDALVTSSRALRLPGTLDTENAATSYENGVLTITLPKSEEKKVKRLSVVQR